jgi:transitional endoplasmic reticulum ATPase
MNEHRIARRMLRRIGRGIPASAPLAKAAVEWAQPHAGWLFGASVDAPDELTWDMVLTGVAQTAAPDEPRPHALVLAEELATLLALAPFDAALLTIMIACDRLPRVAALAAVAGRHGHDLPRLLGELAGAGPHDAERLVRCSLVLRLGLVGFVANRQGEVTVDVRWVLERLLDRAPAAGTAMIDTLVGVRQPATLSLDDFAHVDEADFLTRLLAGAARERAAGINILVHGPPGTGKTEFARTITAAAGIDLHAIGEADEDGEEPTRWERVSALGLAQRVLGPRGGAALLFDEMEDLIGGARPGDGDWFAKREGSKVFVNRMLEANPVPVIWTTNAIGNVDDAILRRMSFVLKLDLPPRSAALRMLDRIALDESVETNADLVRLIDRAPETATVLRVAARASRLAGGNAASIRPAQSLVRALRDGELPIDGPDALDVDLFETDIPLAPLLAAIRDGADADVSLLLTGVPGTGKTAFAHHCARALDRPLIVKRASDLLSKWVGETEVRIAGAFLEARRRGGVLFFDEVDSILFDRTTAKATWEVTQVNELLTWLDRHPLPVIAATNHPDKLDPATLRRFVFKLRLRPLGQARAALAFRRFFGSDAPKAPDSLTNLTPGDFAVVARQLRHLPARSSLDIVERLACESAAKPERGTRIGF